MHNKKHLIIFDLSGTLMHGGTLVEGAEDVLRYFHEKKCTLAIATSISSGAAKTVLAKNGVDSLFTIIAGSDLVFRSKPDPEMIDLILTGTDTPKESAVMIGDAKTDIAAAHAAGIDAIGITGWSSREELAESEPENIIDKLSELQETILV